MVFTGKEQQLAKSVAFVQQALEKSSHVDIKLCFPSQNLTEAIQNGVYPVGSESQVEDSNWDFSNSFFFAGTVVSTIGRSNAFHVCVCVCVMLIVSGY